jgi:hypothetical protein
MFKIILMVWVIIWIFFTVKSLVSEKDKSTFKHYVSLVRADWEGKRAIVYGQDLYEFAKFCKSNLPDGASYQIIGMPRDSIDTPRFVYYLYPFIESHDSDFILVYKNRYFSKQGAYPYALLNKENFILKCK